MSPLPPPTPEEKAKEQELLAAERKRVPHLFVREPMIDSTPFLRLIGIEGLGESLPLGYLRLWPSDFIVEEIDTEGTIHTVDVETQWLDAAEEGRTYYADLVKIATTTFQAKKVLAALLGIKEKRIGHAGLKDRMAITSQRLSFRDLPDSDALSSLNTKYFFLKNIFRGKGIVARGQLQGNQFTIAVRLPQTLAPPEAKDLQERIARVAHEGFWNFYSFQRFGTPRLISHLLGMLLLKGDYSGVLRTLFVFQAPRELPYFNNIRKDIETHWEDWEYIEKRIAPFPSHFVHERALIHHLRKHPKDVVGALSQIPEQIKIWVHAYDSFLFNRKLSESIRAGEIPTSLPLAFSKEAVQRGIYEKFRLADGVPDRSLISQDFPFVRIISRSIPTMRHADISAFDIQNAFIFLCFSLPKGAYATTFLAHFFTLVSGFPLIKNIPVEVVDTKAALALGNLEGVWERFSEAREEHAAALREEGVELF